MRIYFIASQAAGLMLNGEYIGVIGAFEKYVDLPDGEEVLAEVIPQGDFLPRNFFINQSLFEKPPAFLRVYLCDGGIRICISRFERADRGVKILAQQRLDRLGVTLLCIGGRTYASCDGDSFALLELPEGFENASLSCGAIGGLPVMLIDGNSRLCVLSGSGKKLFCSQVESYSAGNMLEVTINYKGCAGYCAVRKYGYDGKQLTLNISTVEKRHNVEAGVMHFAFFESILYGGDCTEYLSEELKPSANALHEYLGDFAEVIVPHQSFFEKYGDVKAVGLAYPVKENLLEVKYYAVDIKDGKIDNVKEI